MQPTHLLMIVATALVLSSTSVFADTTTAFDPFLMRECPQADGTALYTNKDLPGCKLMTLKELSVVPSLDNMPTYRPTPWLQLLTMIFHRTSTAVSPV